MGLETHKQQSSMQRNVKCDLGTTFWALAFSTYKSLSPARSVSMLQESDVSRSRLGRRDFEVIFRLQFSRASLDPHS